MMPAIYEWRYFDSNATKNIPIVFVSVSDPVGQSFVSNLARPGGNITGFTAFEFSMGGKWIEILKKIRAEACPRGGPL
jgi:putative ABC transport system substrate-binding protein